MLILKKQKQKTKTTNKYNSPLSNLKPKCNPNPTYNIPNLTITLILTLSLILNLPLNLTLILNLTLTITLTLILKINPIPP